MNSQEMSDLKYELRQYLRVRAEIENLRSQEDVSFKVLCKKLKLHKEFQAREAVVSIAREAIGAFHLEQEGD